MTHRGPFQPLAFCDSVILSFCDSMRRGCTTTVGRLDISFVLCFTGWFYSEVNKFSQHIVGALAN